VVTFSSESLKQISGPVKQAVLEAHTSDVNRLADLYPEFQKVLDNYKTYKDQVVSKRGANTQRSGEHVSCRNAQAQLCSSHAECRAEQARRWRTYLTEATAFQTVLTSEETCTNATSQVTKDSISVFKEKLEDIEEAGQKTVEKWQHHHDKMLECDGIEEQHSQKKAGCDTQQRELEQAVCENHRLHQLSRAEVLNEWSLITTSWATLTSAVKQEEEIRKNEFAALHEVECLLENIRERGGQPCSEKKDEAGQDEADLVVSHCRDEVVDLSNWTITIQAPPAAPVIPADRAFPCTSDFLDEHYKDLHGDCHELAPCDPCQEVFDSQSADAEHDASLHVIQAPHATELHLPTEGECVSGVLDTEVDFAASHTVRLQLRMPAADAVDDEHQRQWLFSAAKDAGAEHWLWSPTGQFGESQHGHIQFGVWNGKQIQSFEGSDETKTDILEATSLTAVYDADAGEYKLYMNGQEKQSIDGVQFSMAEQKLYVGVIPGAPEADTNGAQSRFTGCIKQVQVFDRDLLASEVSAFADEK
jgi:hypothetical protein